MNNKQILEKILQEKIGSAVTDEDKNSLIEYGDTNNPMLRAKERMEDELSRQMEQSLDKRDRLQYQQAFPQQLRFGRIKDVLNQSTAGEIEKSDTEKNFEPNMTPRYKMLEELPVSEKNKRLFKKK